MEQAGLLQRSAHDGATRFAERRQRQANSVTDLAARPGTRPLHRDRIGLQRIVFRAAPSAFVDRTRRVGIAAQRRRADFGHQFRRDVRGHRDIAFAAGQHQFDRGGVIARINGESHYRNARSNRSARYIASRVFDADNIGVAGQALDRRILHIARGATGHVVQNLWESRPLRRSRLKMQVRDLPGSACCSTAPPANTHRRQRSLPRGSVRSPRGWQLAPVPAITGMRPRRLGDRALDHFAVLGRPSSVADSPVVPTATIALVPSAICHSTRSASASPIDIALRCHRGHQGHHAACDHHTSPVIMNPSNGERALW